MATNFPQFPRLPHEIRRMIWLETMEPEASMPFPYHTFLGSDLNAPKKFIQLEVPGTEEPIELEVPRAEQLLRVRLPAPKALRVTRESRAAAHEWMRQRGAVLRANPSGTETPGRYAVTRLVDWASGDVLYVPREDKDEVEDLALQIQDGEVRPERVARGLGAVRFLALPAFTAYYSLEWLVFVVEAMPKLEKVFVVWGDLPLAPESGEQMPYCWRLEEIPEDEEGEEKKRGEEREKEEEGGDDDEDEDEEDEETGPVVSMCHVDERNGRVDMEQGRLGGWMDDIYNQLAFTEMGDSFSSRFVSDAGEVTLDFVPVQMAKWDGDEWRLGRR
ncbi:hypothetical protein ACO1O0_006189 [Amphichorda felina]